jgi:Short-chain dehydrogenases of various substrate specificities
MKTQNKTFIVTGAGNGMGREMTLQLLSKGAKVIAIDINQSGLDQTKALANVKEKYLTTFILDISRKEEVETGINALLSQVGEVDGLINNAGIIQPFVKLNDLNFNTIQKVFDVNFWGTLYLTKYLLPHFLTRPEAHIVNISSMGGFLPVPGQTIYGATKAAVKLTTEGLAQELKGTNVKVSVVFPGAIGTNIMRNSGLNMPGDAETMKQSPLVLDPSKAAKKILNGIEKDKSRIFIGLDSNIMNWLYRINATFAANLVGKQMKGLLNQNE